MGIRTTLSLLILVGGLAGLLLLLDDKPSEEGAVQIPLLEGRLSSAVKIRWKVGDRMPIQIERLETGYFMTDRHPRPREPRGAVGAPSGAARPGRRGRRRGPRTDGGG